MIHITIHLIVNVNIYFRQIANIYIYLFSFIRYNVLYKQYLWYLGRISFHDHRKKIKFVRNFRKMVQQQLGEAVGIEGKGATNRIAQYECDYRIPQNDILIDMAKSMNITYYSS